MNKHYNIIIIIGAGGIAEAARSAPDGMEYSTTYHFYRKPNAFKSAQCRLQRSKPLQGHFLTTINLSSKIIWQIFEYLNDNSIKNTFNVL